jgi:hypothetical protein
VHADHVLVSSFPEGFHSIGSTENCECQGVWEKGRVLTYQAHAEFDRFVNRETVRCFGKMIWNEEVMEEAIRCVERDDDAAWAAGVILRFFLETRVTEGDRDEKGGDESVIVML